MKGCMQPSLKKNADAEASLGEVMGQQGLKLVGSKIWTRIEGHVWRPATIIGFDEQTAQHWCAA